VTGIRRRKIRGHKLTLDDAQVMRIRAALASGATTRALAKRFGVSTTTIKGAAIGRGAYGEVVTPLRNDATVVRPPAGE
jgi:hypothetical protein